MNRLYIFWNHVRGRTCHTCAYLHIFMSSGDGQVSKRHAFCRNPDSPYANRPIPNEAWCPHYRAANRAPKEQAS
ncbi:MAG TPA: hypothetical protein EYP25_10125 [Anaerolineae bacterium]|nr:hypothetical protein [Caldilineae bacterium]HID34899.1 hypothetical protein [Anaerolineae bacterium]HIQ11282.1 hypothetical protein [Caldilineales bacterium]